MAEPFLAQILIVGFNFAPRGFAYCDGQILPINQNQSLYSLLGTTYGGDGRTSFALPDFRSRTPIHVGNGYSEGQKAGAETVTLTRAQIPAHRHDFKAQNNAGNQAAASGHHLADLAGFDEYVAQNPGPLLTMANTVISNSGGGQSHNNEQPYLTIGYCIALQGLFPSRN